MFGLLAACKVFVVLYTRCSCLQDCLQMSALTPARALRPEKRDAILRAARKTFARMGFTRATIDAIATEADVSTRTLYKHFRSKDELFATVLQSSATVVADDYEATVRAGVAAAAGVRERLMVLARARTKQALGHPEHFAMVRQIATETEHFPPGALAAWRAAGPDRVRRETIAQLQALHTEGLLEIDDLQRAARHFFALTTTTTSPQAGEPPLSPEDVEEAISAGVEVFARGYAPR